MARNHGWFWQNLNDTPMTIAVTTSRFYRRLKDLGKVFHDIGVKNTMAEIKRLMAGPKM